MDEGLSLLERTKLDFEYQEDSLNYWSLVKRANKLRREKIRSMLRYLNKVYIASVVSRKG